MEANGWLERTSDTERAKARRGYRITPKGRRLLGQLRRDVTELYEEVVLGREPSHDPKVSPKTPGSRSRGRSPEAASARSPKADTGSA
jgi:DNA-binding PadR family transcriptional regulator